MKSDDLQPDFYDDEVEDYEPEDDLERTAGWPFFVFAGGMILLLLFNNRAQIRDYFSPPPTPTPVFSERAPSYSSHRAPNNCADGELLYLDDGKRMFVCYSGQFRAVSGER